MTTVSRTSVEPTSPRAVAPVPRATAPVPVAAGVTAAVEPSVGLAPRTWLIWSLAAVTVALSTANPVYRMLVALAALDVLLTWLQPGRRIKPLAIAALFAAGFAVLINVLASHSGVHVLATMPSDWPLVGGNLTVETLAFGGVLGLGLVAALLAVAPLSLILEPHDVVDAMPAPLERTGIAVATSLNLVSGIGRTFRAVSDAQRMRGWRPRGLRSWNEVLVPVILTCIEDSVLLAEAMEARGFGAGKRTSYAVSAWSRWDVAVVIAALAGMGVFVGLRLAGAPIDWYPYPALIAPPVAPLPLVGCVALALPALARPRGAAGRTR